MMPSLMWSMLSLFFGYHWQYSCQAMMMMIGLDCWQSHLDGDQPAELLMMMLMMLMLTAKLFRWESGSQSLPSLSSSPAASSQVYPLLFANNCLQTNCQTVCLCQKKLGNFFSLNISHWLVRIQPLALAGLGSTKTKIDSEALFWFVHEDDVSTQIYHGYWWWWCQWSGMGVGIAVPSSAIYIAEISSPDLRGNSTMQIAFQVSGLTLIPPIKLKHQTFAMISWSPP